MGDYFDQQPDEVAVDKNAIYKQMNLIEELHKRGSEVIMSSHVLKFITAFKLPETRFNKSFCIILDGIE